MLVHLLDTTSDRCAPILHFRIFKLILSMFLRAKRAFPWLIQFVASNLLFFGNAIIRYCFDDFLGFRSCGQLQILQLCSVSRMFTRNDCLTFLLLWLVAFYQQFSYGSQDFRRVLAADWWRHYLQWKHACKSSRRLWHQVQLLSRCCPAEFCLCWLPSECIRQHRASYPSWRPWR